MKKLLFLLSVLLFGALLNAAKGPDKELTPEHLAALEILKNKIAAEQKKEELVAEDKQPLSRPMPNWRPSNKWTPSEYVVMSDIPSRLEAQRQRIIRTGGTPELKINESGRPYYNRAEPKPQPRSAADFSEGKSEEEILKEVQHDQDLIKEYEDTFRYPPRSDEFHRASTAMLDNLSDADRASIMSSDAYAQHAREFEKSERDAEQQRMQEQARATEQARRAQRTLERQQQRVAQRPATADQAAMSESQRQSDLMSILADLH